MINQKKADVILPELRDVYLWFKEKLQIISPDSRYLSTHAQIKKDSEFKEFICNMIRNFDTGIEGFKFVSYQLMDKKVNIPDFIKKDIAESIEENEVLLISEKGEYFMIFKDENEEIKVEELVVVHQKNDSKEKIEFHFRDESDGTLRIFNLLPVLYQLTKKDSVVLIDEIGRSLHSLIPMKFIEYFFKTCKNHENQLIITTHELMMLNLAYFRRDEIWFIAKNSKQASCLYSLEEFKTRFDKDLLNAYLDGRYNAIPIL
jgi:AAA15 family ATPase/GTPase